MHQIIQQLLVGVHRINESHILQVQAGGQPSICISHLSCWLARRAISLCRYLCWLPGPFEGSYLQGVSRQWTSSHHLVELLMAENSASLDILNINANIIIYT